MNKLLTISLLISLLFLTGLSLSLNSSDTQEILPLQSLNGIFYNNTKLKIQQQTSTKVITRDIQSPKKNTVYFQENSLAQDINQIFTMVPHPNKIGVFKFQLDSENSQYDKLNLSVSMDDNNLTYVYQSTENDAENDYIWWSLEKYQYNYLVKNIKEGLENPYLCGTLMYSQQQLSTTLKCNVIPDLQNE